jgi:hypothetical protein
MPFDQLIRRWLPRSNSLPQILKTKDPVRADARFRRRPGINVIIEPRQEAPAGGGYQMLARGKNLRGSFSRKISFRLPTLDTINPLKRDQFIQGLIDGWTPADSFHSRSNLGNIRSGRHRSMDEVKDGLHGVNFFDPFPGWTGF